VKRNREAALLEESLQKANRMGRVLRVVFFAAAAFFVILAFLDIGFFLFEPRASTGGYEWASLASGLAQDVVMFYSFVVCALIANDASKSETPFSCKQRNRALRVAWFMLAYTIVCFFLDPIAAQLQYSAGSATVGLYAGEQAGDLYINFETLIAAGAFFLFSYILNYGKTLQELADETA